MDGSRFDTLVKTVTTTPLTRANVLRGLAASVAVIAGLTRIGESGAAKKNHEKKVKVCKCPTADATLCNTKKLDKDKAKKVARRACNYKGKCQAGVTSRRCVSSCPSGQKVCAGTCIASGLCCTNAECPADRATCCAGTCVDLATNPSHCGTCGRSCISGGCIHGACTCNGTTDCPTPCVCIRRQQGLPSACAASSAIGATTCDEDVDCDLGSVCGNSTPPTCSMPCSA